MLLRRSRTTTYLRFCYLFFVIPVYCILHFFFFLSRGIHGRADIAYTGQQLSMNSYAWAYLDARQRILGCCRATFSCSRYTAATTATATTTPAAFPPPLNASTYQAV